MRTKRLTSLASKRSSTASSRPRFFAPLLLAGAIVAASCASADETPISLESSTPTTTVEIGPSPTPDSPDPEPLQVEPAEGELADLACGEGVCGTGFRTDGIDYLMTCGALDLDTYDVANVSIARGRVSWSDEPIEVREINDSPADEFVAVSVDGDICQDQPGQAWYVASAGEIDDLPGFCDLLGTVPIDSSTCDRSARERLTLP